MSSKDFYENADGVHLVSPVNGEYSVCGDAWDGNAGGTDYEFEEMKRTTKTTVTCPKCIQVIEECRGVRVKKLNR